MNRLMQEAVEKAQARSITITTYSAGPQRIIMEGTLIDRRFTENYLLTGEKKPAGIFHHFALRLLMNIANRQIEDVDLDLIAAPREECAHVKNSLDPLKGEKFAAGIMRRIQTLIRKDESCAHVRTLLTAMVSTASLGFYSVQSQEVFDLQFVKSHPEFESIVLGTVKDTCFVWREEGTEFRRLARMIEAAGDQQRDGE